MTEKEIASREAQMAAYGVMSAIAVAKDYAPLMAPYDLAILTLAMDDLKELLDDARAREAA